MTHEEEAEDAFGLAEDSFRIRKQRERIDQLEADYDHVLDDLSRESSWRRDAELMVRAMSKYRFAVFPAWSEREYWIAGNADDASHVLWCVAGCTCHDDGTGVPELTDDARKGLMRLMEDTPDHERPGFWRRLFMRLVR